MSTQPNLAGGVKHGMHNMYMKFLASVTPVPTVSQFKEQRVCLDTVYGDYLVQAFPSWEWYGGVASKQKGYLGGREKQCLVTRKAPCNSVSQLQSTGDNEEEHNDGDWVCPGTVSNIQHRDIDVPEVAADEIGEDVEDDPGALPPQVQNRRLYDLYITYDLVYKVPRFWLVGFDASLSPLTSEQICADVSPEHAGLTLTWDPHPHENIHAVSIHPCRHAQVMKELLNTMEASGKNCPVDHYLLVFLKFITALIPSIEYDYAQGG